MKMSRKKKTTIGGLLGVGAATLSRRGRRLLGSMARRKRVGSGAKFLLRSTSGGRRRVRSAMGALGRGRMYAGIAKRSFTKAVRSGGMRGALKFLRG